MRGCMLKRILLISPNQHRSLPIQVALLRSGLMVEVTGKPCRALAIARHRPPTAIVIDGAAAELDGDRFIEMLKESLETDQLPIVVLSGGDDTDATSRAIEPGAPARWSGARPIEQYLMESLRAVGVL